MAVDYSGKQQLAFDTETSWAESSSTFTYAASLASPVDPSGITQEMLDPSRVTAYRNAYSKGVRGPWKISYSTTHNLTGHGSTCAGAISATAQARLLGHVLGGRDTTLASGTTYTGGTATAPTTTSSGTLPPGGMVRSGALADGRGGGQFHAVSTHSGTTLNLLTGTGTSVGGDGGAPGGTSVAVNAADILYSPELVFMADSAQAMSGMRHRLLTGNLQWGTHGAFPTGISFSGLGPSGRPQYTINWTASRAAPLSVGALPQSPAADEFPWQTPSAGGSLFMANVGTASRANACYQVRDFSIDYQLAMNPAPGGAGIDQYQQFTGATRGKDTAIITITVDAADRTTTPAFWDAHATNTNQHILYTLHSVDGTAVSFYFRNCSWFGDRPPQTSASDRNVVRMQFRADVGTTTTSDLTLSPMLIAIA